eukprot:751789-Hanusia_phi.AAC.5
MVMGARGLVGTARKCFCSCPASFSSLPYFSSSLSSSSSSSSQSQSLPCFQSSARGTSFPSLRSPGTLAAKAKPSAPMSLGAMLPKVVLHAQACRRTPTQLGSTRSFSANREIPHLDDMIYELGKNKDGTDIDESNLLITKLIKMSENFLTEMAELANQGKHYEVIDLCERAMEEYKCFQEDLMDETVENNEAKLQILHSIAALNFSASTSAEAIKDHRKAIRCLNIVMESFPRVAELLPMFYMVRAVNYGMIGEREKSLKDLEVVAWRLS